MKKDLIIRNLENIFIRNFRIKRNKISLTSLNIDTDSTEEFNFIMNIRSNGTGQNTIELNIAK